MQGRWRGRSTRGSRGPVGAGAEPPGTHEGPGSGYLSVIAPARRRVPIMLWKVLGRWVLVAVAVPLAAAGARKLSSAVEARRGASRGTRLLRRSADALQTVTGRRRRRLARR